MRLWGGKDYLEAVRLAYVLINEHAEELNRLNVFPVPDGDTGINMSRTLAPVTHIREGYALNVVSQLASEAILRSSRGNSGSILATFFLGFAKAMERINEATSTELLAAFKRGTNESYQFLVDPTEGTILTVMRDVSNVTPKSNIETTLEAMENEAAASLKRTPTLLPILEKAGVVDAGGLGFYYLVKGFHLAALGLKKDIIDTVVDSEGEEPDIEEDANFRYCVEGILQKKEKFEGEGEAKDLRKELNDLGGSLVFIETAKVVKFHVTSMTITRWEPSSANTGRFSITKSTTWNGRSAIVTMPSRLLVSYP
jgi:dihydroxyacetone kinase-like predicted kinase